MQVVAENPAIDKGVYLGFYNDVERFRYREDRRVCIVGPSGEGKSCAIGVPNFMLPRSIICLDPEGQLVAITVRLRAGVGKNIVPNPYGLHVRGDAHPKSCGRNPRRVEIECTAAKAPATAVAPPTPKVTKGRLT